MAKKTWLNSKEPPPQWIAWCLIILVSFGIMLIVTGMDLEDCFWIVSNLYECTVKSLNIFYLHCFLRKKAVSFLLR